MGLFVVWLLVEAMGVAVDGESLDRSGAEYAHLNLFTMAAVLIALVNDGWSGRPSLLPHQLLLLPITLAFGITCWRLLFSVRAQRHVAGRSFGMRRGLLRTCVSFELIAVLGFEYEGTHFRRFGYAPHPWQLLVILSAFVLAVLVVVRRQRTAEALISVLGLYSAGLLYSIRAFPLNYLRSDMLPVIVWADQRLWRHLNPYATMHVADRLYDFPYLPGMLLAFLPAVAAHADVRYVTLLCVLATGTLLYWSAEPGRRAEATALCGVFVLSPFLQYRHDLYLAPHWLLLLASIVLLQRNRPLSASAVFGVSMALYQFSWVLFPFWLLYLLRSRGWRGFALSTLASLTGMALVVGPFLRVAMNRIARNTVGQWSHMPHALADPLNLSYWLTFLVRPDQLKWLQLGAMSAIFAFCILRGRCATLTDTLRWMAGALTLFVAMNVLVDGYFYLTVLLVLLMYTFAVAGIWREPTPLGRGAISDSDLSLVG